MLVDRITLIEGEPLSLTSGRVVTEHDVRPGAWYLDGGRVAACVAIESGQADLFLSAWLGIDFRTRGLAVYRLLDAKVTFYRGLPTPGQMLRYDIHIDRFFRQGDTHLFRFRFEGTADGEPLLTMTDGVAGFFTAEELASGKGVVQTELDRRPMPGVQPDDEAELPPRRRRILFRSADRRPPRRRPGRLLRLALRRPEPEAPDAPARRPHEAGGSRRLSRPDRRPVRRRPDPRRGRHPSRRLVSDLPFRGRPA